MSTWFITHGYAEVYPGLVVGAYPRDADDVAELARLRIARVLNLVEDSEYGSGERAAVAAAYVAAGIEETRLQLVDFGRLPADRIEAAVGTIRGWLADEQRVYAHCRAGWQRSASVATAVVAVSEHLSVGAALQYVQLRKPTADPLPHQRDDLAMWWAERMAGR